MEAMSPTEAIPKSEEEIIEHDLSFEGFMKHVLVYNPKAEVALIKKAFKLAKDAHKGQLRLPGPSHMDW